MESRSLGFLLHFSFLMFLICMMSIIYCYVLYSSLRFSIWEKDISLQVTKFTIHCRMQGPQSRIIRAIMTTVNIVFHQSPFTQVRTKVQKGIFSLDIVFIWFFISFRAVDTLSDRSGIYTQHLTLILWYRFLFEAW